LALPQRRVHDILVEYCGISTGGDHTQVRIVKAL
jgi:hypothetical protein